MDKNLKAKSAVQDFIEKYNLVIQKSETCDKTICMRSSISSSEEAELFVKQFSHRTKTRWVVCYQERHCRRIVYHKFWICHRRKAGQNNILKGHNCEAKLSVKIKKITPSTEESDPFLCLKPPLPCIIRLSVKHNHSLEDDLKHLKLTDEEKDIFYGYFDNGFGIAKALKLYNDARKHSTPRLLTEVYYLYRLWQEKKRITGVCADSKDLVFFDVEYLLQSIPVELLKVVPEPKIERKKDQTRPNKQILLSSTPPFRKILPSKCEEYTLTVIPKPKIVLSSVSSVSMNDQPFTNTQITPPSKPQFRKILPSKSMEPKDLLKVSPKSKKIPASVSKNDLSDSNTQILPSSMPQFRKIVPKKLAKSKDLLNVTSEPKIIPTSISASVCKNDQSISNTQIIPSMPQFQNILPSKLSSGATVKTIILVKGPLLNQHGGLSNSKNQFFTSANTCPSSLISGTQALSSTKTHTSLTESPIKLSKNCILSSEPVRLEPEPLSILPDIYDHRILSTQRNNVETFVQSDEENSATSNHSQKSVSEQDETINARQICLSVYQEPNSNLSSVQSNQTLIDVHSSAFPVSSTLKSSQSAQPKNKSLFKQKISNFDEHKKDDDKKHLSFDNASAIDHSSGFSARTLKRRSRGAKISGKESVHSSKSRNMQDVPAERSMKIKLEPVDDYEEDKSMESESSNVLPVITNVSSITNSSIVKSEGSVFQSQIDEKDVKMDSYTNENLEDEDRQFLMSLLPEFRKIPPEVKTKVRSKIQSLISYARMSPFKKKRQKKKKRSHEEKSQRTEVLNSMYRECRTLPSFPTFK